MGKYDNREIFKDTERLIKTNSKLQNLVRSSIEKQELILENDNVSVGSLEKYESDAKVIVS